nr:DUF1016 domain-containing protein [Photobacterium sp. ZSDE20]
MAIQVETKLIHREGNAINNFHLTLPDTHSDLASETFKDPYCFDFLNIDSSSRERDIEKALVSHVTKFLLELGQGFALVGQQHRLTIGGDEFFIDLLFYHLELRCYVVIELKATDFKPEHLAQLNFYLAAIDAEVKKPDDAPTIGLLLCRKKNRVVAEYAVRNQNSPIGIAEFKLDELLPDELESKLPAIEDIEAILSQELLSNGVSGND